ncbi:MAG: hypothetical protein QOD81_2319 [Solirubrobacteraceae bacterium]|nr:hypothetical protein [Solirubrobacteraceae bacterium]MEA2322469.1 hypothetical protein [Solirubrobacteraceae bacterium]
MAVGFISPDTKPRTRRRLVAGVAAAALVVLAGVVGVVGGGSSSTGAASTAQTVVANQSTSANWAGYVNSGAQFSSVSGSWVVPAVTGPTSGYSAFWVGLGGASSTSQALEQVGTESDYVDGEASYVAWYELVPAASQPLALTIHPGDQVSAQVTVHGTTVTVSLADKTTGKAVTKTLQMPSPDTSSAEWIAETPSTAASGLQGEILPLADFGTVDFTKASATAGGHTGSITDSHWTAEQVDLGSPREVFRGPGPGYAGPPPPDSLPRDQASAVATPSPLTSNGSAFSVSGQAVSAAGQGGMTPAVLPTAPG